MTQGKPPTKDEAQESLFKAAKYLADRSVDMYQARNTTQDVYNVARASAELFRAAMGEERI